MKFGRLVRAARPEAETIIIGSRMPDSLKKWGAAAGADNARVC